ncbi:hypothetical protein BDV12DRAFT_198829 [Aspergillus spectabilis]
MSSLDDYLDDLNDLDLSDFDLPDPSDYDIPDLTDYDISDYLPTSTGSSSAYPTSSYGDVDEGDYSSSDYDSSDYDSSDYESSDYDFSDLDISDYTPQSGDGPPGLDSDFANAGLIGTDYSQIQTSDSCVSEVAFKTTGPRVDLAFDVIFLVLFIVIAVVTAIRLLKSKQKGAALGKWFLFPASLFFAILYLFIDMITLILSECLIMRIDKFQQAQTAVRWFDSLSVYLLIVLILLPICLKLQQGGGKLASLTLVVHSILLALCGIFLLVGLATYTRIQDSLYRKGDSFDLDLTKATRGVTMAYYVFLFLGALLAAANMFFALFRKSNIRRGALFLSIPVLGLSTLALTLVLMGGFADREYGDDDRSAGYIEKSGDAVVFLTRLFYALAFLSALVIAGSHETLNDSTLPPVAPMSQPPVLAPAPGPGPTPAFEQAHAPVPVPAPYASTHA